MDARAMRIETAKQLVRDNPGRTPREYSTMMGESEAAWVKRDQRHGIVAGVAKERASTAAPSVDPADSLKAIAQRVLTLFAQKTEGADPDEVSFAELGTATRALERLLAQPTATTEPEDPSIKFRVDVDRALFSELPPLHCRAADFRKLTFAQREALLFLIERAAGSTAPWRQQNQVAPSSPEESDPNYEAVCAADEVPS